MNCLYYFKGCLPKEEEKSKTENNLKTVFSSFYKAQKEDAQKDKETKQCEKKKQEALSGKS